MRISVVLLSLILSTNIHSQQIYKLKEVDKQASCIDYIITNDLDKKITLPEHIQKLLKCPSVINLNQNILTYIHSDSIKLYNLESNEEKVLFSLL